MKMPGTRAHTGFQAVGVGSPRAKTRGYKNRNIINTSKQRGTAEEVKMLRVFYILLLSVFLFFSFFVDLVGGSLCEVGVFYRSFDFFFFVSIVISCHV